MRLVGRKRISWPQRMLCWAVLDCGEMGPTASTQHDGEGHAGDVKILVENGGII